MIGAASSSSEMRESACGLERWRVWHTRTGHSDVLESIACAMREVGARRTVWRVRGFLYLRYRTTSRAPRHTRVQTHTHIIFIISRLSSSAHLHFASLSSRARRVLARAPHPHDTRSLHAHLSLTHAIRSLHGQTTYRGTLFSHVAFVPPRSSSSLFFTRPARPPPPAAASPQPPLLRKPVSFSCCPVCARCMFP